MTANKKKPLPEGWRWVLVDAVLDHSIKNPIRMGPFGSQLTINELVTEGILVLGIEHVISKTFNDTGLKFITEDKFQELKGFEVKPGDVLITMMGTIGRTAVVPVGIAKSIIGSHLLKMRLRKGICPEYIAWVLSHRSPVYKQIHLESQGAIMQGLNTGIIKKLFFPLPPTCDDQVVIVNKLERKMADIGKTRQAAVCQKEAVTAMQGAILREAFPYKEGDKLPEGWKWERIGNLGDLSQGGTPSTHNHDYWNGKIPFITGADVTELYISKARSFLTEKGLNSGKTQQCEKGDLLIVSRTRVGRIGIAATTIGISQDMSVLKAHNGYDVKYLAMYLKSISQRLVESCQGATIKGLTRDYIENIPVLLPPTIDDQMAIANQLERKMTGVEKMRQAVNRQFGTVEALPGAILREAFDFEKH